MAQYDFTDGYVTDHKLMDKKIKRFDPDYYSRVDEDKSKDYLNNIQGLLSQYREVQGGQYDPASLGAAARSQKTDYTPQLASALANLSAQAGTIDGQTADTGAVSAFANTMDKQRREQRQEAQQQVQSGRKSRLDDLASKLQMFKAIRGEERDTEKSDLARERFSEESSNRQKDRELKRLALLDKPAKSRSTKTIQTVDDKGIPVTQIVDSSSGEVVKSFLSAPPKPKQPSQSQAMAAGFGRRLEAAEDIISRLAESGYNRAGYIEGIKDTLLPEGGKSSELQEQNQAERNFVNAVLRRESGAAIAPSEFESAEVQYFPRAGDSPQVLANKDQNRKQALASLKAEAGDFWERVPAIAYTDVSRERDEPIFDTAYASPAGSQDELKEVNSLIGELRRKAAEGDKEAQDYLDSLGG